MSEKETRTGLQAIARWEMEALEAWFAGDTPAASENAAQLPGGIRRHVDPARPERSTASSSRG